MTTTTRVTVTIKGDIHDPAGVAVKQMLCRQGLSDIADVRIGKVIDITFNHEATEIRGKINHIAKSILSNPVMEDFVIEIIDEKRP